MDRLVYLHYFNSYCNTMDTIHFYVDETGAHRVTDTAHTVDH